MTQKAIVMGLGRCIVWWRSWFWLTYDPRPRVGKKTGLDISNRGIMHCDVEIRIVESLYKVYKEVDAVIALDQVVEENTGGIPESKCRKRPFHAERKMSPSYTQTRGHIH